MNPTLQTLRRSRAGHLTASPGLSWYLCLLRLDIPVSSTLALLREPCSPSSPKPMAYTRQPGDDRSGVGGWFRCIGWLRGGREGRPLCTGELPIQDRTAPMSGCNHSTFKWLQLPGGAHLCEKGTYVLCTHLCEHVPVSAPHLGSMCTSYSWLVTTCPV